MVSTLINDKEEKQKVNKLERKIKQIILVCLLLHINRHYLITKVKKEINKFSESANLLDKQSYLLGAYHSSLYMIKNFYDVLIKKNVVFNFDRKYIQNLAKRLEIQVSNLTFIALENEFYSQKYEDIVRDTERLKKHLKLLEEAKLQTYEKNKRPIALTAKVDLDVKQKINQDMVKYAYDTHEDLWWLSSHVGCSERCKPRQGKLVSLHLHAIDNTMWTGMVIKNQKVYSFMDIENQVDKYGYKNNIINGFNCRHFLVSYDKHQRPPKTLLEEEIYSVKNYNLELMRTENYLNSLWTKYELNVPLDTKHANAIRKRFSKVFKEYEKQAKKQGYEHLRKI